MIASYFLARCMDWPKYRMTHKNIPRYCTPNHPIRYMYFNNTISYRHPLINVVILWQLCSLWMQCLSQLYSGLLYVVLPVDGLSLLHSGLLYVVLLPSCALSIASFT